jgi:hypothetical protein
MRAIELRRRFASRSRRGTPTGTARVGTVSREPLEKVGEVFDRVRAEQIEAQASEEGALGAGDPWTRANRAAFLILEGERRALAPRLHRAERHRRDRYRDLILMTKLARLEYEHLVGRLGRDVSPSSLPDGPPAPGGDTPADWARPWGLAPMVELRSTFLHYQRRRDRLAKWLSAPTGASAAANAARHLDGVVGRVEKAMGGYRLVVDDGQVSAPKADEREPRLPTAGDAKAASNPVKPGFRTRLGLTRRAAVTAALFLAAGIGTIVAENQSAGHLGSASALSGSIASPPERPLVALTQKSRGSAQGGGGASHGPGTHKRHRRAQRSAHRGRSRTSSTASEVAPAEPAPAEPAPTATTPAPAPAPPPTAAPAPAPQPQPQPASNPHPGPVSSLPAPVSSLPDPGSPGG